jgi:hypothetical protein
MKKRLILKIIVLLFFITAFISIVYYYMITKAFDIATNLLPEDENYKESTVTGSGREPQEKPAHDGGGQILVPGSQGVPGAGNEEKPQTLTPSQEKQPGVSNLQEQVTFEDKRRIIQLITRKLSSSDIKYLLSLAKGGLTEDEKKRAVKLAYERFTPEEINEIKILYARYKKYVR